MTESERVDHDPTQELVESEAALTRAVTARTGRDRFRTTLAASGHVFDADEPEVLGGGDTGPAPFDFLCAALASCTTITLRMYADRKDWPLEEIEARVEHGRVASAGDGPIDEFRVELKLTGELDAEQRERLAEIASRCPVHRTLIARSLIQTRLA